MSLYLIVSVFPLPPVNTTTDLSSICVNLFIIKSLSSLRLHNVLRRTLISHRMVLLTAAGTGGLNVDGYFSQSKFSDFGRTRDMSPGAGRIQDSGSMDDVVDHVRSLNQALSDLLTTDTTARPQDTLHARSSQARGVTSV